LGIYFSDFLSILILLFSSTSICAYHERQQKALLEHSIRGSHIKNLRMILKNGVRSLFASTVQVCRFLSSTLCSARISSIPKISHQHGTCCTGSLSVSSTSSSSYFSNKFVCSKYIVCLAIPDSNINPHITKHQHKYISIEQA